MGVRFVPSSFFLGINSHGKNNCTTEIDDIDDDETRKIHRLQTIIQT